jgi:mannose/cellobiose epimerase-like protein (N-acyl-D-glucosamine 2-epimerase family)
MVADGVVLGPEGRRLLSFASASVHRTAGFGWLDDSGVPVPDVPLPTWITARMTYVFTLAAELDVPATRGLAEHGVRSLRGAFRDPGHGGWWESLRPDASGPDATGKSAYTHAFVALAAASAATAGLAGAEELLDDVVDVLRRHFLDDGGRVVEGYDAAFTTPEDYRGANATMHMVEAALVLGDVVGDDWHRLALGMAEHLVHDVARRHEHLLPEHFTPAWEPLLDYNSDRRDDPFRPYGCTPGHLLEWSRLLAQLEASLPDPPAWLLEDAEALFDTAVRVGWAVDGAPGFVYTVDWTGAPVVRQRMHWVLAEAIAAAAALGRRTGDPAYARWEREWWAYAEEHLVDRERGSWRHELDPLNRPSSTVWQGKPDVYHAFGAILLPRLPLAPSPAVLLARH